jgi:hypothetical protein
VLRERWTLSVWIAIGATGMTWLAAALPSDAFFSGDSGVKLIAARNAIAHPGRPFRVDLPEIEGRGVPYVERFFEVHDDHAHALQSPLFPVASALPISAFGLRGAFLLPILSFLSMLPLLNVVRRHIAPTVPVHLLAILTILASPVFFYALEFWEHAPAIACLTASTAIVMTHTDRLGASRWAMVAAGCFGGLAILLRPEATWYVLGLAWLSRRQPVLAPFLFGGALLVIPFALANLQHSGNVAGSHISANLTPLLDHWLAGRAQRVQLWLVPSALVGLVGLLVAAATWMRPLAGIDLRRRQAIALLGAATLAVAGAAGLFNRESLWNAWPAASLLLLPFAGTSDTRKLSFLALLSIGGIALTATHDGGAQWGPRFVVIASPALILLAAVAAADATKAGSLRSLRFALVALILLTGLWTTRAAYRELRGTKQYYARLVSATESLTDTGSYVLSNVWWFDQVVASLYNSRTFLYAGDASESRVVLRQLAAANVSNVTLVWTRNATEGAPLDGVVSGTCYRITQIRDLPESDLTFADARCSVTR